MKSGSRRRQKVRQSPSASFCCCGCFPLSYFYFIYTSWYCFFFFFNILKRGNVVVVHWSLPYSAPYLCSIFPRFGLFNFKPSLRHLLLLFFIYFFSSVLFFDARVKYVHCVPFHKHTRIRCILYTHYYYFFSCICT